MTSEGRRGSAGDEAENAVTESTGAAASSAAAGEPTEPTETEIAEGRHLAMDFALRVGEVLLASGAGAAEVGATVLEMASALDIPDPSIDVTFNTLTLTSHPEAHKAPYLMLRHVDTREVHYEGLLQIHALIDDVRNERADLEEARERLTALQQEEQPRPRWLISLARGGLCAAVGLQLGGTPTTMIVAAVAAVAIDQLQAQLAGWRLPHFYRQVAGGAIASLVGLAAAAVGLGGQTSLVVTATIVMLLAGVSFMGAIQDALTGYPITAAARLIEAIVATAGIIAGVGAGLRLADTIGVGVVSLQPGGGGWVSVSVAAVGAGLAAAAAAYAAYAPLRVFVPVAAVSGVAMLVNQAFDYPGLGRTWAAFAAAFFIGVVCYALARRLAVPTLVLVVAAITPMLPGLSIYKGLSALAEGGDGVAVGLLSMITASTVAVALASGTLLGEYAAWSVDRGVSRGVDWIGERREARPGRR